MKKTLFIALLLFLLGCTNSLIPTPPPDSVLWSQIEPPDTSKKYYNPINIEGGKYDLSGNLMYGLFSISDDVPWNNRGIFDIKDKKYSWAIAMHPTSTTNYATLDIIIPPGFKFFNTKFMYTKHLREQTDHPTPYLKPGTFRGLIYLEGKQKPEKEFWIKDGIPNPDIGSHYFTASIDISNYIGKKLTLKVDACIDISAPSPARNWADHATWVEPNWSK